MRRVAFLLSCLALAFSLSACQRLEVARPLEGRGRGDLPKERLPYLDAVPAAFGDLVGVTVNSAYPVWAQAWFERPDKSIAIVWVNTETGSMMPEAVVIPRR
ncbi:MAG TPA: hypothetical protein VID50_03175 [Candidatus Eisenbacteria bacterium]|jgi:hypothetical protein